MYYQIILILGISIVRTTDFMTRINVPVSSRSSKQYMTSGSFPFALAAAIAAGGIVILGKEYIAPVQIEIHSLVRFRPRICYRLNFMIEWHQMVPSVSWQVTPSRALNASVIFLARLFKLFNRPSFSFMNCL